MYATNTWRYLRLAMVAVVLALGTSVAVEHAKAKGGCFQTSISAYYYTPVRGVFVGALVTLGVCLICLRGSTDREDLLLNIAGMLAPVVAFVPTPDYRPQCTSVPPAMEHAAANIANNTVALLIVSGIALLGTGCALVLARSTLCARIGAAAGAALWVITLVVFLAARNTWVHHAHEVAALLLFVCIVGAAIDNARETERRALHSLYVALAAAMTGALVTIAIVGLVTRWSYWMIVVETVVLTLFVVFWVVQTVELWDFGIRLPSPTASRRQ